MAPIVHWKHAPIDEHDSDANSDEVDANDVHDPFGKGRTRSAYRENHWPIWVKHQCKVQGMTALIRGRQGKANFKELQRQWNAMTKVQKKRWGRLFLKVEKHRKKVEDAEESITEGYFTDVQLKEQWPKVLVLKERYIVYLRMLRALEKDAVAPPEARADTRRQLVEQIAARKARLNELSTVRQSWIDRMLRLDFNSHPSITMPMARASFRQHFHTAIDIVIPRTTAPDWWLDIPAFFSAVDPLEIGWQPIGPVGRGGFSEIQLAVKLDQHRRIIDRICIKDAWYEKANDVRDYWDKDHFWAENDRYARLRKPMEVFAMEQFSDSEAVVKLRGWSLHEEFFMYRLYMKYCGSGNTFQCVNHPAAVPEPFLWYLFQSLTNASILMDQGDTTNRPGQARNWQQICHRDLKPENVFLGSPSASRFQGYPAPKIGDWGLAIKTNPEDPKNPTSFVNVGTDGNIAPEQKVAGNPWSSALHVWTAGIFVMSIMEKDPDISKLDFVRAG